MFGFRLNDGSVLPPASTDSPNQSVFMKRSLTVCSSDATVNVYQAEIEEVFNLVA